MAVLVTGGTGLIGALVVKRLVDAGGADVHVLDANPRPDRLGEYADSVSIRRGDVGNLSHLIESFNGTGPEAVFHLGSMLSAPSEDDHSSAFRVNAEGTFNVLEAARLCGIKKVLFSSTIGTYGYDLNETTIDDDTLQRPIIFYGATKVFAEHMGLFYRRKYGIDFRSVRYPSIIGPGVSTPGLAQYTTHIFEKASAGENYVIPVAEHTKIPIMHVEDAADALIQLSNARPEAIGKVNYLVSGVSPTPTALELTKAARGRAPEAQFEFVEDSELQPLRDRLPAHIDDKNARTEWGWQPSWDLDRVAAAMIPADG